MPLNDKAMYDWVGTFQKDVQPCIFFTRVADFTVGVRISDGPKKVFASVAYVLSCSEFEELFDLCFNN